MLQYLHKESSITILIRALKGISTRIYTPATKFHPPYIDAEALLPVLMTLGSEEVSSINRGYLKCAEVSNIRSPIVDLNRAGWDQFRLFYYMQGANRYPEIRIRQRAASYLCGLMKLAEVYSGSSSNNCSSMGIVRAPLVADMASLLLGLKEKYITYPSTTSMYSSEESLGEYPMEPNRVFPWFPTKIVSE